MRKLINNCRFVAIIDNDILSFSKIYYFLGAFLHDKEIGTRVFSDELKIKLLRNRFNSDGC
tara:strand:- start:5629 stop:5811 length:183 start_codon:yes stop_codon:yes gene_type:complete